MEIIKTDGFFMGKKSVLGIDGMVEYLKKDLSEKSKLLLLLLDCYPYELTFDDILNNGVMKDNALYSSLEELISNGFMVKVLVKKDTIEKELYFVSCDNIIDKNIANEKLREYTESGYSIIEITTSNMQI
ncbi:hypothetical protein [Aliarcobacter butzleri]|uniref:hypothetical protein n=1 Tax=Aliarcobacter butzleri TaxID=28197 RepID=UPI0021B1E4D5|nr:hypothetical protein [Aliarcobacter butzleri]MCT7564540.1 hypothetical protein [Aliarcobacter butzleri]MCT7578692.1 hypothetical protein [Aliarcobacter butzleri]